MSMSNDTDFVGGWEILSRPDGGSGVYDSHGLVAGPFGTKAEAIQAALKLPRHPSEGQKTPRPTVH